MVGACVVPLMALVLAISPDAASLVARLGTGTLAEREETAKALEAMGRESLAALGAALVSPDAEVRSTALSVWERVQKRLMVRPSMVRLEGEGRPLTEVIRSIGEQVGFSLEISGQRADDVFNVRERVPISFWQAVDRLGLVGRHLDAADRRGGRFPTLIFEGPDDGCPPTISGPFRIKVTGLHDHRDRRLVLGPWLEIDDTNQRIPILRTARQLEARFYVDLGVMIEPRMWFTQEGPARAIEAVDDLGRSLVRRDTLKVQADHSLFSNGGGVTEGRVQLDLAMPDKPGGKIVRLRGSIPVAIQVRRPVPALEIPLSSAKGKTFAHEDAVFTVREFQEDDLKAEITLDVRINLDRCELPAGRDAEIVSSRLRCLTGHQLEIVDADGNLLNRRGGSESWADCNARMSYRFGKNGNKTRSARLRYYGMVRAFTDVAFEFRMIPMP